MSGTEKVPLRKLFPKTRSDLLDILEKMLEFNPMLRPTAGELLKESIFDSIREKENESVAPHKISLSFDKKNYKIDYENDE